MMLRVVFLASEIAIRFLLPIGGILFCGTLLFYALGWVPRQTSVPDDAVELAVVAGIGFLLAALVLILANRKKARESWRPYVVPEAEADGSRASGGSDHTPET